MRQVVWIGFRLLESQMLYLHLRGSSALGVSSPGLGKAGRRRPGTPNPVCCRGSGTSRVAQGQMVKYGWANEQEERPSGRGQTVEDASRGS